MMSETRRKTSDSRRKSARVSARIAKAMNPDNSESSDESPNIVPHTKSEKLQKGRGRPKTEQVTSPTNKKSVGRPAKKSRGLVTSPSSRNRKRSKSHGNRPSSTTKVAKKQEKRSRSGRVIHERTFDDELTSSVDDEDEAEYLDDAENDDVRVEGDEATEGNESEQGWNEQEEGEVDFNEHIGTMNNVRSGVGVVHSGKMAHLQSEQYQRGLSHDTPYLRTLGGSEMQQTVDNTIEDGYAVDINAQMSAGNIEPPANFERLRNVLKLPKAHKWVYYEWFFSNLDRPLLLCDNDFRCLLRESMPTLKTKRLTRSQWSLIRRMLGKPRRCSFEYFKEERRILHERRDKVRALQAKRPLDLELLRDLPDDMHVPIPLIIGTAVNARIRSPHDGIFSGIVDALDNVNHFYRITFDKTTIGTRSVPDYEVLSSSPQETIPLSAFKTQHKASRNLFMSPARLLAQSALPAGRSIKSEIDESTAPVGTDKENIGAPGDALPVGVSASANGTASSKASNYLASMNSAAAVASVTSALLHGSSGKSADQNVGSGGGSLLSHKLMLNETEIYGGYPMKFLVMVTKLSKILEVKKLCIEELDELNTEIERKISIVDIISQEFQTTYLTVIVQLERLNKELQQYMVHVMQYANEIAIEHGVTPVEQTTEIRTRCAEEANAVIHRVKLNQALRVRNSKNFHLIQNLVGTLIQLRSLGEQKASDIELSSILESLLSIKLSLQNELISTFEVLVEAPIEHIVSGMSPLGHLYSFLFSDPNQSQFM